MNKIKKGTFKIKYFSNIDKKYHVYTNYAFNLSKSINNFWINKNFNFKEFSIINIKENI